MSKITPGIALGEIDIIAMDLDVLADVMVNIGHSVPGATVRPDWIGLFGRILERAVKDMRDVMEKAQ
jgi:hypothetical protein